MGKQGPCYHCGVTSTPLWRNGPPEKPVLCNACGSRWRTKGTLANYTPLHARTDCEDYEDHRPHRLNRLSTEISKEETTSKRKQNLDSVSVDAIPYDDASNRSSSGSAISNPESGALFCGADFSDMTCWDSIIPSRKRTCFSRPKPSPVEKLTKDLHTILHEQQSYCSSEDYLLFERETPLVSEEFGHGTVLIRNPKSISRDEDSEASSLSVENREKLSNETKDLLGNHYSPLCHIDLTDLLNFEEFGRQLSRHEQQVLLKYLPPTDAAHLPESIKQLFESPQFKECLSSYQQLLAEGVYDQSFAGADADHCDTLIRLTLFDLSKCKWIEHYNRIKSSIANVRREGDAATKKLFAGESSWCSYVIEENSEHELLLDVPSHGPSAEAELLPPERSAAYSHLLHH